MVVHHLPRKGFDLGIAATTRGQLAGLNFEHVADRDRVDEIGRSGRRQNLRNGIGIAGFGCGFGGCRRCCAGLAAPSKPKHCRDDARRQ